MTMWTIWTNSPETTYVVDGDLEVAKNLAQHLVADSRERLARSFGVHSSDITVVEYDDSRGFTLKHGGFNYVAVRVIERPLVKSHDDVLAYQAELKHLQDE